MTYIISVANEKGGVAKTTSTISLAASMVETGLEVLVIDLDAQANLTLALGVEINPSQPGAVDILLRGMPADRAVRETSVPRLSLIPSTMEMVKVERQLPLKDNHEAVLDAALRNAGWQYDYILLDCPPFLGAVTHNALMASDILVMPTQAEFFSINALRNMMATVRKVRQHGNPRLTYRLLLTMFDRRNRIHRTMCEQLRATFNHGVLDTVIEVDTKLRESSIAGLPIIFHAPKSRSALQYRALAQEILAYVQETNQQPT